MTNSTFTLSTANTKNIGLRHRNGACALGRIYRTDVIANGNATVGVVYICDQCGAIPSDLLAKNLLNDGQGE